MVLLWDFKVAISDFTSFDDCLLSGQQPGWPHHAHCLCSLPLLWLLSHLSAALLRLLRLHPLFQVFPRDFDEGGEVLLSSTEGSPWVLGKCSGKKRKLLGLGI